MNEEDEITALLAKSNAQTSSTSQLQDRNHRLTTAGRQSLRDLERISRDARRLFHGADDTASVDGLLLDDDDASVGSGLAEMFGNTAAGGEKGRITAGDLEYLQGGDSNNSNDDDYMGDVNDSERGALVDRMGEQLLLADSSEKEARLIRQSLRLSHPAPPASVSSFDVEGKEGGVTTGQVSDRVHRSARALRSTLLTSSQRGSRATLLEMMREDKDYDDQDLEKQRTKLLAPSTTMILRILSVSILVMIVLYLLLLEGTVLAGPPRLPVGPYKIVEAQVGHKFFDYYDFYSGKDSAGSNGYLFYVSREVAERDNIVNVSTETVDVGSMVEIYDDDGAQEVDWLLEDLKFLDDLKRRQADEKKEAEESAEEAASGNTTTDKKVSNSTAKSNNATILTASSIDKDNSVASIKTKNTTTRHLAKSQSHLEAFNPDPVVNGTINATGNYNVTETFVYISSNATEAGPRNSVRLEGRRRFNRGLFIIDLRHMPAGTYLLSFFMMM